MLCACGRHPAGFSLWTNCLILDNWRKQVEATVHNNEEMGIREGELIKRSAKQTYSFVHSSASSR
jgi:hypothetical protein